MKLVIEIDKRAFDYIMACSFVEDEAVVLNQSLEDRIKTLMFFDVLNAIKSGTPLPKGHGNLVDRDAINDRFYNIWKELESYSNKPTYKKLLDRWSMCMDTAPTIIDAEEEEE